MTRSAIYVRRGDEIVQHLSFACPFFNLVWQNVLLKPILNWREVCRGLVGKGLKAAIYVKGDFQCHSVTTFD